MRFCDSLKSSSFVVVSLVLTFLSFGTVTAQDFCVLETEEGFPTRIVEGNETLAAKKFSPGSTFKIVLAMAALEEGIIDLNTQIWCADRHVPETPRLLSLHEALVYSSNDFFRKVVEKIGEYRLNLHARESQFCRNFPAESWLKDGLKSAVHGGNLSVSPVEQHDFIKLVMGGNFGKNRELSAKLLSALEWPSPDPCVKLFGKTGAFKGAVWFNGFGVSDGKRKAVTVFYKGPVSLREYAIKKFYSRWKLEWKADLMKNFFKK